MAGSSALQAALHRSFLDESASALGLSFGSNCFDVEKFYEMIDLSKVASTTIVFVKCRFVYFSAAFRLVSNQLAEQLKAT